MANTNSNRKEAILLAAGSLLTGAIAASIFFGYAQRIVNFQDELNEFFGFVVIASISTTMLIASIQTYFKKTK